MMISVVFYSFMSIQVLNTKATTRSTDRTVMTINKNIYTIEPK